MGKTIRDAYGESLIKYGTKNKDVIVLDADVSSSTRTCLFKKVCPDRFFNFGIAEANMAAFSAGLASVGKIPFVNTFATFITSLGLLAAKTYASYAKLPIKLIGSYGGISDSFDGPSHHSIEDISIMRSLPNIKVYTASDVLMVDWLVRNAIEDKSPMYIRLSRAEFPRIYEEGTQFEDGKGYIVRDGSDATVFASGIMVSYAIEAAELLKNEGIYIRVVDMFCIKPIDEDLICRSSKETGAIVTAEEHNIIGGLRSAVAEVLCANDCNVPLGYVGLRDTYAESGPYEKLLFKYGLHTEHILQEVKSVIKRKHNK